LPHLWPTGSSSGWPPIDYGPVLLLMPFGFHLAVDTLPSGFPEQRLQVHLVCIRLSPSCPHRFLHTPVLFGRRGATPAFGYDAPHSSARGTSTLLNNALLSAHYGPLRHPEAPGPSLAGVRLIITDHPSGLPVLRALPLCTCRRHYPGAATGCFICSLPQPVSAFPGMAAGSARASTFSVGSRTGAPV
jgi:hypothetical protein